MSRWKAEQPLGMQAIASGLRIRSGTLAAMRSRSEKDGTGKFPTPDGYISDRGPWWYESTLVEWAIREGFVPPTIERTWDAVCRSVRLQGGPGLWKATGAG